LDKIHINMELKEKYTTDAEETKKILITNEAYAICEFIELLKEKIDWWFKQKEIRR